MNNINENERLLVARQEQGMEAVAVEVRLREAQRGQQPTSSPGNADRLQEIIIKIEAENTQLAQKIQHSIKKTNCGE